MKIGVILVFLLVLSGCGECSKDSDCMVYGEDGDCNCGCYTLENMPSESGGACFCAAPKACKCVDGECEGVFK